MSIASDLIRGHIDLIILAHLVGGDHYGYEINKAIAVKTDGQYELKEASLYTALRRMEQSGFIYSYWGNETTGARRRYYSITDQGRKTFVRLKDDWESAKKLIDQCIKEEGTEYGN